MKPKEKRWEKVQQTRSIKHSRYFGKVGPASTCKRICPRTGKVLEVITKRRKRF